MKFESYQRPRPSINLTALIDVLFILVVFVMLAANFEQVHVLDVSLPHAEASSQTAAGAVVVVVPASGPARIKGQAIADADLEAHLRALGQGRENPALIMIADRHISLDRATAILSAATRAGFQNVSIATQGTSSHERDTRP